MRDVLQITPRTILLVMVFTLLMGVAITVAFSSTAQALLFDDDTSRTTDRPVRKLLSPVLELPKKLLTPSSQSSDKPADPSATPAASGDSSSGSSAGNSSSSSAQGSQQGSSQNAGRSSVDAKPIKKELKDSPSLHQVQTVSSGLELDETSTAALASTNMASISGVTSDFGMLRATENGWQLFGILWYWWLLFAALITGAVMRRDVLLNAVPWRVATKLRR